MLARACRSLLLRVNFPVRGSYFWVSLVKTKIPPKTSGSATLSNHDMPKLFKIYSAARQRRRSFGTASSTRICVSEWQLTRLARVRGLFVSYSSRLLGCVRLARAQPAVCGGLSAVPAARRAHNSAHLVTWWYLATWYVPRCTRVQYSTIAIQ